MTANSAATWLTSLEPMPSASAIAIPLAESCGSAGARKPKKSWLTLFRPRSEHWPTETLRRGARTSSGASENILRRGLYMRGVEREAGERQAADEVAHHRRDLVPQEVIHHRELRAQKQARREQEHVDDRVLEHHVEEHHDRHPHREHLAAHVGGDHRADDTRRHHPVAQHAAHEE